MAWKDVSSEGLNQSKLKMYQRCPKQYEFVYVKGLRRPPNLKLTVGTAVHKGIEVNYAQKVKTKRDCKKDVVLDATRDGFKEAVKKDEIKAGKLELGKFQDEAIIMADKYHDVAAPTLQPIVKPEYYFEIPIEGAKRPFYGTIDLVAQYFKKNGSLVVSDTKTTRRAYDRKRVDVDLQLTAYVYAVKHAIKKVVKYAMFDTIVLTGAQAKSDQLLSTRSEADLSRFKDTFRTIERGIQAGIFPPVDSEMICSWCAFRRECLGARSWT